jgi:uncharacterized protein
MTHSQISPDRPLISKLLILFGLVLVCMAIGYFIGMFFFTQLTDISLDKFQDFMVNPTRFPNAWNGLMILQAFSTPLPFIAAAMLYWKLIEKRDFIGIHTASFSSMTLIVVTMLVIGFMPFDGMIIELNKQMVLPDFLKGIEKSMRDSEDNLGLLTKYMTDFSSRTKFYIALFVVAVLAGISEEFIFRGTLQNILLKSTNNHHIAIWISAIVFSAIHFQFYGFFPRMLLGAMFGYLYYWSQNIWVAAFAHFVNNGFTLLMVYLFQQKITKTNIETSQSVPLPIAFMSLLFTGVMLLWMYRNREKALALSNRR